MATSKHKINKSRPTSRQQLRVSSPYTASSSTNSIRTSDSGRTSRNNNSTTTISNSSSTSSTNSNSCNNSSSPECRHGSGQEVTLGILNMCLL